MDDDEDYSNVKDGDGYDGDDEDDDDKPGKCCLPQGNCFILR